jgi:hypothetical protein
VNGRDLVRSSSFHETFLTHSARQCIFEIVCGTEFGQSKVDSVTARKLLDD